MMINIAIAVILLALQVGELMKSINKAAIMMSIGMTLKTTVYSFRVLSVRSISD